jgi:two-component system LytT family response regulator
MLLKAVVIDDEENNVENLSILLQKNCPQVTVVASARNAIDGEKIILQHEPDIVFLDIQMPGKSGFDLLTSLTDYSFEVIFVTAFDQYGIQAIKFSAIDYLLKPVNPVELKQAVQKALSRYSQKKQNLQLENLIQYLQQQHNREQHRIALTTIKEIRPIPVNEIVRCESTNNYTAFFLAGGEKLMVSKPIYEYDEMLNNYGFIRCHQSHLVNKKYIKSWVKEEGGYLLLQDGTTVPVARSKKEMVRQQLDNFI